MKKYFKEIKIIFEEIEKIKEELTKQNKICYFGIETKELLININILKNKIGNKIKKMQDKLSEMEDKLSDTQDKLIKIFSEKEDLIKNHKKLLEKTKEDLKDNISIENSIFENYNMEIKTISYSKQKDKYNKFKKIYKEILHDYRIIIEKRNKYSFCYD